MHTDAIEHRVVPYDIQKEHNSRSDSISRMQCSFGTHIDRAKGGQEDIADMQLGQSKVGHVPQELALLFGVLDEEENDGEEHKVP